MAHSISFVSIVEPLILHPHHLSHTHTHTQRISMSSMHSKQLNNNNPSSRHRPAADFFSAAHPSRSNLQTSSTAPPICLWSGQISWWRHSAQRSGGARRTLEYTPGSLFPSTSGSALKQPWLQAPDSSRLQPTHVRVLLYSRWARHHCTLSGSGRHTLIQ